MAGKKHSGITGPDGSYSLSGLEPGEYKIKIQVPEIPSWYQKVTVTHDEMIQVEITKPVYITVGEVE